MTPSRSRRTAGTGALLSAEPVANDQLAVFRQVGLDARHGFDRPAVEVSGVQTRTFWKDDLETDGDGIRARLLLEVEPVHQQLTFRSGHGGCGVAEGQLRLLAAAQREVPAEDGLALLRLDRLGPHLASCQSHALHPAA